MLAHLLSVTPMSLIRRHVYLFHITMCYVQYLCLCTFTKKPVNRKAILQKQNSQSRHVRLANTYPIFM